MQSLSPPTLVCLGRNWEVLGLGDEISTINQETPGEKVPINSSVTRSFQLKGGKNHDFPVFIQDGSMIVMGYYALHRNDEVFGKAVETFKPNAGIR